MKLDIAGLRGMHPDGDLQPSDVVAAAYDRIARDPLEPVWISLVQREMTLALAKRGARLLKTVRTESRYALEDQRPAKPGLVRV
jgi:hypothetical protein